MAITVTSSNIEAQINSIDKFLADLEAEATSLSFSAIGGDKAAAEALAGINSRIAQVGADRVVLARAMGAALSIEDAARREAVDVERAAHLAKAKAAAAKLLDYAGRADELVREHAAIALILADAENETRLQFRLSGGQVDIARRGRADIVAELTSNLENYAGVGDFANKRGVADWVRVGWAELLNEVEADRAETSASGDQ